MPNHETNNVVILGAPDNIRRFVAEAFVHPGQPYPGQEDSGEDIVINTLDYPVLNFNLIKPQPDNIEKGGCSGEHAEGEVCWYTWNIQEWGTKWGAYEHTHYELSWHKKYGKEEVYGRVDLRFETAWSQPEPIFEAIQERWGVRVYACTQDEGGFPDVYFPDQSTVDEADVLRRIVTFEFDSYDSVAEEPVAAG